MKIKQLYEALSNLGLTSSQMEFSRIWLGRSPRYYSHLLATQREPGIATLCGIGWRLERLAAASATRSEELLAIKQAIADHIEHRAITDRKRRNRQSSSENLALAF